MSRKPVLINIINNVISKSFLLGGCVKFKHDPNNNNYYYYYSINRVTSPILLEKTGSFIVLKKVVLLYAESLISNISP